MVMHAEESARMLLEARRQRRALVPFPADLPLTAGMAEAIQSAIIRRRSSEIAGWKVGMIQPEARAMFGRERFLGPVFGDTVYDAGRAEPNIALIPGGSAAIEAEFVCIIDRDVHLGERFTKDTVLHLIAAVHIGIEVLTSPVGNLPSYGSAAVIADQGFNGGLVIGAGIAAWRTVLEETIPVSIHRNGETIAVGDRTAISGGLLTALEFAVSAAGGTARGLKAGDCICLGALAGMHAVTAGTTIQADFGRLGQIEVRFSQPD